jgi:hypothetical protein
MLQSRGLEGVNRGTLYGFDISDPARRITLYSVDLGNERDFAGLEVVGRHGYLSRNGYLLAFEMTVLPYLRSIVVAGESILIDWHSDGPAKLQRATYVGDGQWTEVPTSEGQTRMELPRSLNPGVGEFYRLLQLPQHSATAFSDAVDMGP